MSLQDSVLDNGPSKFETYILGTNSETPTIPPKYTNTTTQRFLNARWAKKKEYVPFFCNKGTHDGVYRKKGLCRPYRTVPNRLKPGCSGILPLAVLTVDGKESWVGTRKAPPQTWIGKWIPCRLDGFRTFSIPRTEPVRSLMSEVVVFEIPKIIYIRRQSFKEKNNYCPYQRFVNCVADSASIAKRHSVLTEQKIQMQNTRSLFALYAK